jgi:hypothetical protein
MSHGFHHHLFDLIHPILDILLVWVYMVNKVDFLLLSTKHSRDVLFMVEFDSVDVFKDLFQVGLDSCGLFGLG